MPVFVLRHADRMPDQSDGLSPKGVKRAKFLAHMLTGSGVATAYCSDAQRTKQTLGPLKLALGNALAINEISAGGASGPAGHVRAVVTALRALPDAAIAVVVSHSNTVGPIIEGLGAGVIDAIGDSEFDKLFVLFGSGNGPRSLLKLRY